MNKGFLIRIFSCILVLSAFLYLYIDKQNTLTKLRIRVPALVKEIKAIQEENKRLQYEIDQFESPEHLLQLAREDKYSHLKQPLTKEILACAEGSALEPSSGKEISSFTQKSKPLLVVGAAQ